MQRIPGPLNGGIVTNAVLVAGAVAAGVLLTAVAAAGILVPKGVDAQEPCDGVLALSRFTVDDAPMRLVYLLAHQAVTPGSHARAHVTGGTIVIEQPFDGLYRWPQAFKGLVYDGDSDGIADTLAEKWRYDGHVDVVGVVVTSPGVVVVTGCFPTLDGHIHGPHVVQHFGRLGRPTLLPATGPAVEPGLVVMLGLALTVSGASLLGTPPGAGSAERRRPSGPASPGGSSGRAPRPGPAGERYGRQRTT